MDMLPLAIINNRLKDLRNWGLEMDAISKDYTFDNAKDANEFVNKIYELADQLNHYPTIMISRERVKLTLTTHAEKGLTSKDFEMAADIDGLKN